ncbi:MAG: hypothetical protein A2X42_05360 [Candidatus Margulisbacteria bacterium GWF2_38_17]|nr:MAG: hypothetical protein A2X42_05360 [Candidatus Margulisbacteria bacterium GWF2_38_17]OGI08995.1 MAG: hypothetical protein A2X41_01555 [Candidatus Margulisbacteria bacterium GWE2_39_32]
MKLLFIFIIIIVLYGSTLYASVENLIDKLDLTHPQVKKLRDQQLEHTRTMESLKTKISENEQILKKEMTSAEPDKEKIKMFTKTLNELRDDLLEKKVDAIMDMRKVMTKDQLRKMDRVMERSEKGETRVGRPKEVRNKSDREIKPRAITVHSSRLR